MFNWSSYFNSRPDGMAVLEIVDPAKLGVRDARLFVPLKRTELGGQVDGPLASLRVTQVYGYTSGQCDKVLEAAYRFPMPGDAAVTGVRVRFGDVEIEADLRDREEAEADYQEAKRQGRQAALATRESPDVFTLQVAGLLPDQDVTVETSYVQLARAESGGWSLRIPLTAAPRYVRSDERTSRHAKGQPLMLLRDPGHRFRLDLTVNGASEVTSSTHQLMVCPDGEALRVQLRDGEVIPDRDCVLSWKPERQRTRSTIQVIAHDDQASGWVYFVALATAPETVDQMVPREAIVLVDHSGSMMGAKWKAADWAVEKLLSGLTSDDFFDLGLFHSETRWLSRWPIRARGAAVGSAVSFLKKHCDSGGTELGVALEQALDLERVEGEYTRHVLIVTDAQVSDEGRLVRLAEEESRRSDRRRISIICIDAAPNSLLAHELAERGGGVVRFLTSAPQENDITTALGEVLAEWERPAMPGLSLAVNRGLVEAVGHAVAPGDEPGWSLIDLGDLSATHPLWVVGRVRRGERDNLVFRLVSPKNPEVATRAISLHGGMNGSPGIKALFGARRILDLEFLVSSAYCLEDVEERLRRLGYDPERVCARSRGPKVYAENARAEAQRALRGLLVSEALDYGLACSETAFIAVRREPGKLVEAVLPVANALPAGWAEEPSALYCASSSEPMASQAELGADRVRFRVGETPPRRALLRRIDVGAVHETRLSVSTVFLGKPVLERGEAVLFDSSRPEDCGKLPEEVLLSRLTVRFTSGIARRQDVDRGLELLIFVDDLYSPRATVSLADLLAQDGERPLNVARSGGQQVVIVLRDANGVWAAGASGMEIQLGWERLAR